MGISSLYVRGPYRGPSGYEHHVREFARELHRAGIALQLEHVDAWSPVQPRAGFLDPWYESLSSPVDSPLALQFCMPNQIVRHKDVIDVNYTMFESSRTPKYWIEIARLIDWTVVPTEFSRQAWLDSGAPEERLRVCPLGVRGELFGGAHEPWPVTLSNGRSIGSYRHRFLNISAWDGRKNLDGLLTAWLKATRATDDAALLLK
ncbi:MAG: glycosyltransferase, partial [Thermomicrobiales bacterium]|nr:glycosyltransferase [Thermomicrobiales bacterium]